MTPPNNPPAGVSVTNEAGLLACPEGWRLVPVELTEAMISAWRETPGLSCYTAYAAMLAAAPTPSTPQSSEQVEALRGEVERLRQALAAKFYVTDEMEKAGVRHALSDSVDGASGGWPGYVRRLWGAMNMARPDEAHAKSSAS